MTNEKAPTRKLRCAVYTRKSTEEGLEQEFNSLHAQREACEAYVASQRSEGWALIRDAYDDGGFSGGTLERPALKALLADIEEGLVDVVVVYKIDRLSRSLMLRKRGGRKMVVTPDGSPWAPRPRVDNAMVKALARAFRWQRMLDDGVCGTIEELARRERVDRGYMSRVLRLTLLAPEIVEAILDGRQPAALQPDDLLEGFPLEWDGRRNHLGPNARRD